jgi:hypothetical protein
MPTNHRSTQLLDFPSTSLGIHSELVSSSVSCTIINIILITNGEKRTTNPELIRQVPVSVHDEHPFHPAST